MSDNHHYIRLRSGRRFSFTTPKPSQFTIEDIAWGLSHINRFLGQTPQPYSVLQHSCLCHDIAPPECKKEALCHDFGEFAVNDVASPCKDLLPQYRDMEIRVERVIAAKFGLTFPYPAAVKVADLTALATEMKSFGRKDYTRLPYPPLDITIKPWSPAKARREFMKRWTLYA